jgi:hypothetical protein
MASEIDQRTRHNHEAAMLHNDRLIAGHIAGHIAETGAKQVVMVNPDANAKGRQGFDSAAHRAFMRSLG